MEMKAGVGEVYPQGFSLENAGQHPHFTALENRFKPAFSPTLQNRKVVMMGGSWKMSWKWCICGRETWRGERVGSTVYHKQN